MNYRKGITVTSLVYNNAEDSLLVRWEATGSYQLHLTSCSGLVWEGSTMSTCSPALLTGIKRVFGSDNVFVDVRTCDDNSKCTFSPPTGAMIRQQTLISLNLSSDCKPFTFILMHTLRYISFSQLHIHKIYLLKLSNSAHVFSSQSCGLCVHPVASSFPYQVPQLHWTTQFWKTWAFLKASSSWNMKSLVSPLEYRYAPKEPHQCQS